MDAFGVHNFNETMSFLIQKIQLIMNRFQQENRVEQTDSNRKVAPR